MMKLHIFAAIIILIASTYSQQIKVIQSLDESQNLKVSARSVHPTKPISDESILEMFEEAAGKKETVSQKKNLLKSTKVEDKVKDLGNSVNEKTDAIKMNKLAKIALKVSRSLRKKDKNTYIDQYRAPNDFCPYTKTPYCNENSQYRSEDGACNNLKFTWWGMANTPFKRLLEPAYDDGIDEPRSKSYDGGHLMNARKIAMKINQPNNEQEAIFTTLLPHFAQFVDHDVTITSLVTKENGKSIRCKCANLDPDCVNIPTPKDDPAYEEQECEAIPRSSASFSYFDCDLGAREQFNTRTHWLDLSQLYGVNLKTSLKLRLFKYGKMKTSVHDGVHNLPLEKGKCALKKGKCFENADSRIHQNTLLTSITTVFLREHNRIADILYKINPNWSDERLYQETRRILIAKYQHIIYREMLPAIVSPEVAELYELEPLSYEYFYQYNPNKYPAVINEFSTAAFRFGHTLIKPYFTSADTHYKTIQRTPLNDAVLNTEPIFDHGCDSYLRGSQMDGPNKYDLSLNSYLANDLFADSISKKAETKRFSLPALNINRGRDHGLQPYNNYRALCGLNYAKDFDDLYNIPKATREQLMRVYKDVNDIDLFIGGISEDTLKGGVVGATFACIIAKQFQDLKFADRFYYENGQDKHIRFTPEQLNEIRKSDLSRILCDNVDLKKIHQDAFLKTSPWVRCDEVQTLSYEPWKDYTEYY